LEELLLQGPDPDAINRITQDSHTIAYYFFGRIADKRRILKDEADEPRSEIVERKA
jgi:hypothetical protein